MLNKENLFSLEGKIIIVTGGTGILGEAFNNAIAEAGGTVGILGRNTKIAEERAEAIQGKGGKAFVLTADVLNEEDLLKAKKFTLENYGKIDGLVNGAGGNTPEGIIQSEDSLFDMSIEGMKKVMNLNLWGALLPTKIFGEAIAKNDSGSIVNISSVSSDRVLTKVLGYSMGKAALDCFNQWFAVEMAARFGDKLRMNSIAPGFFLTEQNRTLLTIADGGFTDRGNKIIRNSPYGRLGHPDELKGALVWLLSDASKFVSGTRVVVDGGFSCFSGV